jgi:hypothetical protein
LGLVIKENSIDFIFGIRLFQIQMKRHSKPFANPSDDLLSISAIQNTMPRFIENCMSDALKKLIDSDSNQMSQLQVQTIDLANSRIFTFNQELQEKNKLE